MIIAITGCGWVTPLVAGDITTVLDAYSSRADSHRPSHYEPIRPEVLAPFSNLPAEAAKEYAVRLAAVALELAWKQAGLNKDSYSSDRKGLVLGSALAGVSGMIDFANDVREQSARFVSPIRFPQTVGNYICGALARCFDFRGPASTIACGSASSLRAIREGCALLASGLADVVVAGGSDLLNEQIVEGLNETGVCFSDGACFFVLEPEAATAKRGAICLANVILGERSVAAAGSSELAIVSSAGCFVPQAISVERWIGRSLGADGASALAAAIGATMHKIVPTFGKNVSDEMAFANLAVAGNKPIRRNLHIRAADTAGRVHELWAAAEVR